MGGFTQGGGFFEGLSETLGPRLERQQKLEDERRRTRVESLYRHLDAHAQDMTPEERQEVIAEIESLYPKSKGIKAMLSGAHSLADEILGLGKSKQTDKPGATPASTPAPAPSPPTSAPQQVMPKLGAPPSVAAKAATPAPVPAVAPTIPPPPSAGRRSALTLGVPSSEEIAKRAVVAKQATEDIEQKSALEMEGAKHKSAMELEAAKAKTATEKSKLIASITAAGKGYRIGDDGEIIPIETAGLSQDAQIKIKRQNSLMDLDSARGELAEAQAALARAKADPNSALNRRALLTAKLAQDRMDLAERNFYSINYGTDMAGNPLPGAILLPDGTAVGRGFQLNVRPTTPTRQMAETMEMLAPKMDALILKLDDPKYADQLGPIAGRWNEFMAGKVGSGNPDYVTIRSAMNLMQTAELRAHVGARGGQLMLAKFDSLNNADRMDAETLKAALISVKEFLGGYSEYVFGATGPLRGARQTPKKETAPTLEPPPGTNKPDPLGIRK
jgi:hypothetical protein